MSLSWVRVSYNNAEDLLWNNGEFPFFLVIYHPPWSKIRWASPSSGIRDNATPGSASWIWCNDFNWQGWNQHQILPSNYSNFSDDIRETYSKFRKSEHVFFWEDVWGVKIPSQKVFGVGRVATLESSFNVHQILSTFWKLNIILKRYCCHYVSSKDF